MSARIRSYDSRAGERGFTLLELLVAAVAGLFVVMAAFLLSRGATRLLTSESRLGSAQQNLRMGIDRLRGDLERASFMTTANGAKDPDLCPAPSANIAYYQGITYQPGGSATTAPQSVANGLNPDAIVLMGNFTSSDLYAVADIESTGGAFKIYLQWGSGLAAPAAGAASAPPAARRLVNVGTSGAPINAVTSVFNDFPRGRLVRLTNVKGSSQLLLMQVSGVSIGTNGQPIITVTNSPAPLASWDPAVPNKRCGYDLNGNSTTLNPVQIVRYQVKSLAGSGSPFAWAYPNDIPADAFKYDLVRTELDPSDGSEIASTAEIVAEYAIDLKFAFSVDQSVPSTTGLWVNPELTPFPFAENGVTAITLADNVRTNTAATPQRIRSIRYRLSTRSRDPDRSVGIDPGGPGLARYSLGVNSFARVRTTLGEAIIRNQQGIRW
jgi:type II secretory pathway pseudopilin PulG